MGTYKIIIAGNNVQLFNVVDYVRNKIPSAEITAIITDGLTFQNNQDDLKITKEKNLPTIFADIEKIDCKARTVYFNVGGTMNYDYFIATATYKSPFQKDRMINAVYMDEDELAPKLQEHLHKENPYVLIVSDKSGSEYLKQIKTFNTQINIKTKKAQEIKQIHTFENNATSVTLSSGELILVDLIIMTSFEMDVPAYLRNLGQPLLKLETNNIYYIENKDDLNKLETLILKAKPQDKYICPSQRKLIFSCKYLEENIPNCESYCFEICKMQNDFRFDLNTFLSRFIESKLNGIIPGDICNLCNTYQCKLPFRICGIDEEEIIIRRVLACMYDSLIIRVNLINHILQIPRKIHYLRDTFTNFSKRELILIFRWLINQNRKILGEINSYIPTTSPKEITSGIANLNPNKDIVLYISKFPNCFSKFYPTICENENLQIVTLGCGGLEVSNQYGFSHIGNITLSEYISQIPNLKLVLIENPCYANHLNQILQKRKIPIIDLSHITVKQFESTIRRIQPSILQNNQSQLRPNDLVLLGNPLEDYQNHEDENVIFLLPCQGDYQDNNLFVELNRLIDLDYIVYTFGCSLSSVMSMKYLNPIYMHEKEQQIKTFGSFSKIVTIAKNIKAKNKFVYAYNLLKPEALLDLFTLTYFYDFKVWDFENVNNNIRIMMNFSSEGNKNEKK